MTTEMDVDGQTWHNVVEWPNEENWHHWETRLTGRTTISIYGHVVADINSSLYGTGEFQGAQTTVSPSSGKSKRIAHGHMKSDTLAEAMKELYEKVHKPIRTMST